MLSPKQNIFGVVILALVITAETSAEARSHSVRRTSYVHDNPSICIQAPVTQKTRRIYKGQAANIEDYPFVVSIQILKKFNCGGTLYSKTLVLTTCSCVQLLYNNRFYRENPRVLSVRVGSSYSNTGGEVIEAAEVFFHPSYDPITLVYNLAVIRLRYPAIKNGTIPQCIEVAKNAEPLPSNVDVLILGWGESKLQDDVVEQETDFLKMKLMPVYSNYFCREVYGEQYVTDDVFCAGTITTGEGACNGDAGGPAILDGQLVGIISSGDAACGTHDFPTVFTHIAKISTWLDRISLTSPKVYKWFSGNGNSGNNGGGNADGTNIDSDDPMSFDYPCDSKEELPKP